MTADEYIELKSARKTTMCAAILYPDGDIRECVKSHLKTILLSLGNDIWEQIPDEESPLFWLTAYTGVVLIDYENQLYSERLTKNQDEALAKLYDSEILLHNLKNIHCGNRYLGITKNLSKRD